MAAATVSSNGTKTPSAAALRGARMRTGGIWDVLDCNLFYTYLSAPLKPGPDFVHLVGSACTLDLTWEVIAEKLTSGTIDLKTGGLGTSIQTGGPGISNVEVSSCILHSCSFLHCIHVRVLEFESS